MLNLLPGVIRAPLFKLVLHRCGRNVFGGQYFYAFGLGGGWQLAAGPSFSYDWESDELTLPIGTGIATTKIVGTLPLKIATQVWYYVDRPDAFGSDWVFRLTLTPVVKALW